ncbi:MAG: hypothetical protein H7Z42_06470 [Roseiflexaceae bacterium]|nr:hypothetical protein [Roseiflexaceae bacterium]
MLQAPAKKTIGDVTIFPDDTLWYLFYAIGAYPSVRRDADGDPVFLLVKYALSKDDREANPQLPPGGGYVNFDIQFEVPAAQLELVRAELQLDVDAEWARLRSGSAEQQAKPGVAGTTAPPAVQIGTPTWVDGKVLMHAPQSAVLVSEQVGEGTPSLLAGNIAVFSMDLTPAGAEFMQHVMVGDGGQGETDLTTIQVAYDLQFWARLPPVSMHVEVDSKKVHEQLQQHMQGRGVDHCTSYDFQDTEKYRNTASFDGTVKVSFDTGTLDNPEQQEALRDFALDLVQDMIEQNFFEQSQDAPSQAQPGSRPAPNDGNPKKYLREVYEESTMHISFDLEQSTVVKWRIAPQATLQTFFQGMPAEELKRYVRIVPMDDDFFKNLELEVQPFADFSDPAIQAIEVEVEYAARDENGDDHADGNTFIFTSTQPQQWSTPLYGGKREYRYRSRVLFRNRAPGAFGAWQTESKNKLALSFMQPGRVALDIISGAIDWVGVFDRADVTLSYADKDRNIAPASHTVMLNPSHTQDRYERLIHDVWAQPVRYQVSFGLKDGRPPIELPWASTTSANQTQLVIEPPLESMLKVHLMTVGDGWDEVSQVVIDLHYRDESGYEVADSLVLKNTGDLRVWKVPLRDKDALRFSYRVNISYKTRFEQIDWRPVTADSYSFTLPIEVESSFAGTKVRLIGDNLNFAVAPLTTVTCEATAGAAENETFIFREKGTQIWLIEVPAGQPIDYSYTVTHHPAGSGPVTLPTQEHQHGTAVVLAPFQPPKAGKHQINVMPFADFAKTPLVVIELEYTDASTNVVQHGALTFDTKLKQTWSVDVSDLNQLARVGFKLAYFDQDGNLLRATELVYQPATSPVIVPKV